MKSFRLQEKFWLWVEKYAPLHSWIYRHAKKQATKLAIKRVAKQSTKLTEEKYQKALAQERANREKYIVGVDLAKLGADKIGEIYKPLKLSEGAELLNKQLMVGMYEWLIDRSNPTVLVSFLDVPIAVDLCELQDKTDDDIVELVQNRIVETLKERLSVRILEKLRG